MIEQRLQAILNTPDSCAILQLNCRRSQHVIHSLFNHELTNLFSILALQEPHINRIDFLPPNHANWTLVSPTPTTKTEESRPRACLYIRKDLEASLNPIFSNSREIATCTIKINELTFLISNIYNAPRTFTGFAAWDELMTSLPLALQLLPMVAVMDANLHSPMWNPTYSDAHDNDADRLIDLMSKWDLRLQSPAGEPTYGLSSTTTRGTTIDLVWVNEQLDDIIKHCFVDANDITSHLSDHQSLITTFTTKSQDAQTAPADSRRTRNWKKAEIPKLLTELATYLPAVTRLKTQEGIDTFDRSLRGAITTALKTVSPCKAPPGKHKYWWRPEVLDPLRKRAQKLHRAFKASKTEENKLNYTKARNQFNKQVDKLKENSWKTYLSTLTHDTLFQAKRFASGRKPSSLVNTLITKEGTVCTTNAEKADLLFKTTCVATAPCRIGESETIDNPLHLSGRTTPNTMPDFFDYLSEENIKTVIMEAPPLKAPGADQLQNWVWQMVWPRVKHHVHSLFLQVTATGLIPQDCKKVKKVIIPKPGKSDYTAASAYLPIALLLTLSKMYKKLYTKHLSEQVEKGRLLHEGNYGGRPNKSGHEALTHLVSWTKKEWSKGRVVGALFADVKSAFPSVHHPRLLNILERKGFNTQTINILRTFLNKRQTTVSFNGFESQPYKLTHGLPQGSPLSPLLYLLYNNALLELTDSIDTATALGFIDDVVLLTTASNKHQLKSQMQTLAYRQNMWAKDHGAIFDVKKMFWVIFSPHDIDTPPTINFVDRKNISPEKKAKWLGITIDDKLTFAQHRLNTLTKGRQRAGFLALLSKTDWGISPKLMKTLLTTTIHAATDYGVAAWLQFEPPTYFIKQMTVIDNICARAALGALPSTPAAFLHHDLMLTPPKIRLQSKIMNFMATALTKPKHPPLYSFVKQAQNSNPKSHHNPFH